MSQFSLPFLISFFGLFSSSLAFATPAQIIIIRHGEKPANSDVDLKLDPQGCARAFSLPDFFKKNQAVNQYGPPVAIYSVADGRDGGSLRPQETATPSAIALNLRLQTQFSEIENDKIATEITNNPIYNGKTVIIVWEHDNIPALAQAFGASLPAEAQKWPGHVFDQSWVIRFSGPKQVSDFNIVPENVLATDNPQGGLDKWGKKSKSDGDVPCYTDQQPLLNLCETDDKLESMRQIALQPVNTR
jgi:hypothetical protein